MSTRADTAFGEEGGDGKRRRKPSVLTVVYGGVARWAGDGVCHHCPTTRPNERKRVRETSEGAKPPSESPVYSWCIVLFDWFCSKLEVCLVIRSAPMNCAAWCKWCSISHLFLPILIHASITSPFVLKSYLIILDEYLPSVDSVELDGCLFQYLFHILSYLSCHDRARSARSFPSFVIKYSLNVQLLNTSRRLHHLCKCFNSLSGSVLVV